MKRLFISLGSVLAATFSLTNCTEEFPIEPQTEGGPFEIIADLTETKTVNDGLNTKWAEGDRLNVFHAETGTTNYSESSEFRLEDAATGKFFTESLNGTLAAKNDWYAIYPYNYRTAAPNKSAALDIGTVSNYAQTGNNNTSHIAGRYYPMWGIARDVDAGQLPNITMTHLSSLLKIKVVNSTEESLNVTNIKFTTSEEIAGEFSVDFSGDTPVFEAVDASNSVYLRVNRTSIEPDGHAFFYLAVKPFTAKSGSSLTIEVNGNAKVIGLEKDVTFAPGNIKPLQYTYDGNSSVITGEVVEVTKTSATIECTYLNVPSDAECGYYYLSDEIDDSYVSPMALGGPRAWKKVPCGNFNGTVEFTISDLTPNEYYQYYAYVMTADGQEINGYTMDFNTFIPDMVLADNPRVSERSATVEYSFYNVRGYESCYLLLWKQGDDISNAKRYRVENIPDEEYAFAGEYTFGNLSPETCYEYAAEVVVDGFEWYSETKSFVTMPLPVARTGEVSDMTTSSVTVQCTYENIPEYATCGVRYNKEGESDYRTVSVGCCEGTTDFVLEGLEYGATYEYLAFVRYNYEDDIMYDNVYYGEYDTFTIGPVFTISDASNITLNSATVECSFSNLLEGCVCGIKYSWAGSSLKYLVDNTDGVVQITLTELQAATEYTYRPYVEVDGTVIYGEEKTFTTVAPDVLGVWSCFDRWMNSSDAYEYLCGIEFFDDGSISCTLWEGEGEGYWYFDRNGDLKISYEWFSSDGQWTSDLEFSWSGEEITSNEISGTARLTASSSSGSFSSGDYDFIITRQ